MVTEAGVDVSSVSLALSAQALDFLAFQYHLSSRRVLKPTAARPVPRQIQSLPLYLHPDNSIEDGQLVKR